jgi:LytR cell envelope-related transcriptional attenuator
VRPGNHAAGDGSFGRSAGINVGKAVALVAVAVVIGGLLLRHNGGGTVVAAGGTPTTAKPAKSTSTTPTTSTGGPATVTPTSAAVRAPSSVKVLVANGTSVGGAATRFSDKLHAAGYDTLSPTNTTARGVTATVVYYAPAYQKEGAAVAQQLGAATSAVQPLPAQPPVASLNGASILVIVGQDLAGSSTGGTGGTGGTTATTRHVVATTTTIKH